MVDTSTLALVIVLVIIIEGIWLVGLTYLMWRRHQAEKAKKRAASEVEPDQPS